MYDAFERDRHLIGPGQFCEVRYEDLVADPVGQMRAVYEQLDLGDFEAVRPAIEEYFADQKDYKTNRYPDHAGTARRNRPPLGQVHPSLRLREEEWRARGRGSEGQETKDVRRVNHGAHVSGFIVTRVV